MALKSLTLVKVGPAVFLDDNNSTEFFAKLSDLLTPGPTFTNVNDFRAIVVDSP
jgi:hydroxypyruvate reductase